MATWEETLNAALTGSPVVGEYPSTVADRLMVALDASFELLDAAGKLGEVQVIAGTEPGPYSNPTTLLADSAEQVRSRWRFDDESQWRNLSEAARQLEANLNLLVAPSAPPPSDPPPPPPPSGGSVVPGSASLVASLDFNGGNLSQWANLQTRDRNGSPSGYCTYSACVRNGGPGHETAARFEVRRGDVPNFGGGERSEVRAPGSADVREGNERWYTWSTRFGDTGFTPPNSGWGCIFMQWHAGDGSPPLCLEVNRSGQVSINNNRSGGYSRPVCPIDAGKWHDFVLHVRFSRSSSNGLVEMWRDGVKLASFRAATMASDHNYLKMGIYRASQSHTQVVWHDGLKIYRP